MTRARRAQSRSGASRLRNRRSGHRFLVASLFTALVFLLVPRTDRAEEQVELTSYDLALRLSTAAPLGEVTDAFSWNVVNVGAKGAILVAPWTYLAAEFVLGALRVKHPQDFETSTCTIGRTCGPGGETALQTTLSLGPRFVFPTKPPMFALGVGLVGGRYLPILANGEDARGRNLLGGELEVTIDWDAGRRSSVGLYVFSRYTWSWGGTMGDRIAERTQDIWLGGGVYVRFCARRPGCWVWYER